MNKTYVDYAVLFKALSDPNRVMIMDMLSCGELCACVILEKFNITQPTLSHHMKTLCECKLVNGRKDGKWIYYSLNKDTVSSLRAFLFEITSETEDCVCRDIVCEGAGKCEGAGTCEDVGTCERDDSPGEEDGC